MELQKKEASNLEEMQDGLLRNDFTEALNSGIVKSAVHPEYTCFLPGDYFRNEMSNLIRGSGDEA